MLVAALAASTLSFASSKEPSPDSEFTDLSDFLTRIVGGTKAEPGEYPYYAQMDGCGGSLIAPNVVLTAAHCNEEGRDEVIVGGYERDKSDTDGAYLRTCDKWIPHPDYQKVNAHNHDFALCLLNEPVNVDETEAKLELNFNDAVPTTDESLTAIGLGTLWYGGNVAEFLQHVEVPYIDNDDCDNVYGNTIQEDMLCAGFPDGGYDSCQGDSGGPLVEIVDNGDGTKTHVQMGVVSFGYGCAFANAPGVYARVSSAETWIKKKVCKDWKVEASFCSEVEAPSAPPTVNQGDKDECADDPDFSWGGKNKSCAQYLNNQGATRRTKLRRKCNRDYLDAKVRNYCKATCATVGRGPCRDK